MEVALKKDNIEGDKTTPETQEKLSQLNSSISRVSFTSISSRRVAFSTPINQSNSSDKNISDSENEDQCSESSMVSVYYFKNLV